MFVSFTLYYFKWIFIFISNYIFFTNLNFSSSVGLDPRNKQEKLTNILIINKLPLGSSLFVGCKVFRGGIQASPIIPFDYCTCYVTQVIWRDVFLIPIPKRWYTNPFDNARATYPGYFRPHAIFSTYSSTITINPIHENLYHRYYKLHLPVL